MTNFQKDIEEIIRQKFADGTPSEIRKAIKDEVKKSKAGKEGLLEAKKMLNLVQKELNDSFIESFTKKFVVDEFENISEKFEKDVLRTVQKAMQGDASEAEVLKSLKRIGNLAEHRYGTVIRTAKAGLAEAQKHQDAIKAGIKYFRYVGPVGGSREFCSVRVGKIFSLEEIEQMSNKAGLPVLYFMGGWNCRHRWVAVSEAVALAERNAA